MSVLEKLTEGIVQRSLKNEGAALLEKWERTGLLEGLKGDSQKNGMPSLDPLLKGRTPRFHHVQVVKPVEFHFQLE